MHQKTSKFGEGEKYFWPGQECKNTLHFVVGHNEADANVRSLVQTGKCWHLLACVLALLLTFRLPKRGMHFWLKLEELLREFLFFNILCQVKVEFSSASKRAHCTETYALSD